MFTHYDDANQSQPDEEAEMTNNSLTADQVSGNVKNQDAAKTINTLAILSSGIAHELRNDIHKIIMCT